MSALEIKAKSLLNLNESDSFSKLVGKIISFKLHPKGMDESVKDVSAIIVSTVAEYDMDFLRVKTGIFSSKEVTVDYFKVSITISNSCLYFDAVRSQGTSWFSIIIDENSNIKITTQEGGEIKDINIHS